MKKLSALTFKEMPLMQWLSIMTFYQVTALLKTFKFSGVQMEPIEFVDDIVDRSRDRASAIASNSVWRLFSIRSEYLYRQ